MYVSTILEHAEGHLQCPASMGYLVDPLFPVQVQRYMWQFCLCLYHRTVKPTFTPSSAHCEGTSLPLASTEGTTPEKTAGPQVRWLPVKHVLWTLKPSMNGFAVLSENALPPKRYPRVVLVRFLGSQALENPGMLAVKQEVLFPFMRAFVLWGTG